jgi:hypothetical protein
VVVRQLSGLTANDTPALHSRADPDTCRGVRTSPELAAGIRRVKAFDVSVSVGELVPAVVQGLQVEAPAKVDSIPPGDHADRTLSKA